MQFIISSKCGFNFFDNSQHNAEPSPIDVHAVNGDEEDAAVQLGHMKEEVLKMITVLPY